MALLAPMDKTTPRGRRPLRVTALALSSAAAIGLMVGLNVGQPTAAAPATTAGTTAAPWAGYADLVEQVMPSVVAITVTERGPQPAGRRPAAASGNSASAGPNGACRVPTATCRVPTAR